MTLFWCITAGFGGGLIGGSFVCFVIEVANYHERKELAELEREEKETP